MRVGSGVETDATTPNNVGQDELLCWASNVGNCCVRLHLALVFHKLGCYLCSSNAKHKI